jgi:dTDP-4-amino-4,6-dideoxygalactose transaminase
VLDRRIDKKRGLYAAYKNALSHLDGVGFMPENDWDVSNRWLSCLTTTGTVRPGHIMETLAKENIESRPVWKPLHLQPVFSECDYIGGETAERIFRDGVCLPSDTKISDEELDRITSAIRNLWE